LNATTAAANAFAVTVAGSAATVTGVTVNGSTVEMTLQNAVTNGQAVTVAYTDPTANNDANAIQDAAGNEAETLAAQNVTNNVPDSTAPVFQSAATSNDGTKVILTYNEALNAATAGTSDFAVNVGGLAATVTGVTVNGSTVELTLQAAVTNGQAVTVAYTDPTGGNDANAVQDSAGNDAVTLAAQNVTNNVPNSSPTIGAIPGTTQEVTTGVAAALPDFTVNDADGGNLTVTLTSTNGSISGVADADAGTAGIQITGTAAQINTALAAATFTATAAGAATVGLSVSDGIAAPVTATYNLNATAPVVPPVDPPVEPPVIPPAAPGATITNPDGTTTTIPTGTGGTTSITSPAPGSTVTITGSGDTTVTSPGPTVTLNNTGTGTVTTTGFTGGSTLNVTGTGSQHIDMTGLQPGDVITINNTGSGTVDLSNLPDGVVVNIVGTGPVVLNDNDGTSASVESMVPSLLANGVTGDGNGDGTPDALQSNVASVPFLETSTAVSNPAGAPPVFISLIADSKDGMIDTTNNLTATLSNVQQLDAPANLPADLQMPLGLISFDSTINIVGATATFSLFVDSSISLNGYWKQNTAGVWCNLATTIVTEGGKTRLDFAITDGGEFDADGIANGVIVDPGAVGSMPQSIVGISAVANNTGFWF
ncbi:MAG: hypothetical protein FIA89_00270, partial [Geobacter sp.]|nr:hypothetical protein [Geobacter sp.]